MMLSFIYFQSSALHGVIVEGWQFVYRYRDDGQTGAEIGITEYQVS